MREIVSVQLGRYANFVGSHFWNLGDEALGQAHGDADVELSSDVYFRRGARGYAPRLQVVDLCGGFGALSVDAGVVGGAPAPAEAPAEADWGGGVDTFCKPRAEVGDFQKALLAEDAGGDAGGDAESGGGYSLDGARFWSDFLKVRLHPRSCAEISGVHAGVNEFGRYDDGAEVASARFLEELYDGVRFFAEECESLGGVQVSCDVLGGFAGVGDGYLRMLRDELGAGAGVVVFGAAEMPAFRNEVDVATSARVLGQGRYNEAMLVHSLTDLGVQYVPLRSQDTLRMPLVSPSPTNAFQTSAVLGTALDFFSTPLRHKSRPETLGSVLRALSPAPYAALSGIALSFPVVDAVAYNRSAVLELPLTRLSSPLHPLRRAAPAPHSTRLTAEFVVARGLSGTFDAACRARTRVALPVPYPHFFDDRLDMFGRLRGKMAAASGEVGEVGEVNGLAALYTDSAANEDALRAYSESLLLAAASRSTGTQDATEQATLVEMAENLLAIAGDCREAAVS